MKRLGILLVLALVCAAPAFAGKIYGSITEGGKAVPQGVKVAVACGSANYDAVTDGNGTFNLFANEKGKCVLKVTYQGQSPSIEINSFEGSVQYDLILEKQGAQYALKRK